MFSSPLPGRSGPEEGLGSGSETSCVVPSSRFGSRKVTGDDGIRPDSGRGPSLHCRSPRPRQAHNCRSDRYPPPTRVPTPGVVNQGCRFNPDRLYDSPWVRWLATLSARSPRRTWWHPNLRRLSPARRSRGEGRGGWGVGRQVNRPKHVGCLEQTCLEVRSRSKTCPVVSGSRETGVRRREGNPQGPT